MARRLVAHVAARVFREFLDALRSAVGHVGTAIAAVDLGQRLVAPPFQDVACHVGDPIFGHPCRRMLVEVGIHHFGDAELVWTIGTTWGSVVLGEVGFEGSLSRANVCLACASANLFLSVENDPGGPTVAACSSEIEAGWLLSPGHCVSSIRLVRHASHIAEMSVSVT